MRLTIPITLLIPLTSAATCSQQWQSRGPWDKSLMDIVWKLREKMCNGPFGNADCGALKDDGSNAGQCYANMADAGHPEIQAVMLGGQAQGKCWDAFQDIINNCMVKAQNDGEVAAWDRGGVYTWNWNAYYLTIRGGQPGYDGSGK